MRSAFLSLLGLLITTALCAQPITKTRVMILGTPHLMELEGVRPAFLDGVISRLRQENFDAVAVENMSAELLLDIKCRETPYWQELYEAFSEGVEFGKAHQARTGQSAEEARAAIHTLDRKPSLGEADRIAYVNAFLCTYDVWSAALHYKQLEGQHPLDPAVTELLDRYTGSHNESNLIGLEIARASGLRQVYSIDDYQDEAILVNEFPAFVEDYLSHAEAIEASLTSAFYTDIAAMQEKALRDEDLLPLYAFYNSPAYMEGDYENQWAVWLNTHFGSKSDRSRYALWEMRNLAIASHILRIAASHPEQKILVIIGASHKSFLEKYLRQVPDIELMDL